MSKLIDISTKKIISAEKSDIDRLKNTLAKAFINDPMASWTVKNDKKSFIRKELMYETMIKHFGFNQGYVYTNEDKTGCAVWVSPKNNSNFSLTDFSLISAWIKTVGLERIPKILRGASLLEKYHYKSDCYYLAALGVDPEFQNRGIGSALIKPVLDMCDEEFIPAFLETSTEDNVLFYQKHGFKILAEINEPSKLPRTWTMLRKPANRFRN